MPSKTPVPPPDSAALPDESPRHKDSVLESIGKAVTNAVWESSGEADKSHEGDERRAANHGLPLPKSPGH